MSRERASYFDQSQTFSESYKVIRDLIIIFLQKYLE